MSSIPTPMLPVPGRHRPVLRFWAEVSLAFALGAGSAGLSWFAAGPGLGLFFGTFLLTSLASPHIFAAASHSACGTGVSPVLLNQKHGRDARATFVLVLLMCSISTWMGAALVWSYTLSTPDISIPNLILCLVVLIAYLSAIAGVVCALLRFGLPANLAAAFTSLLSIAWLTWPVWLSGLLSSPKGETIAGWLVPLDPLIAINSVLKQFGAWDHAYSIAYNHLTTLNQDAPYRMPRTILPSVIFHAVLALAGLVRPINS